MPHLRTAPTGTSTCSSATTRAIAKSRREFGLDTYPNQIEIITSEQMLDAYASSGLPVGYPHWSYGKEFIRNEQAYRRGMQGLAYEIVINSDPVHRVPDGREHDDDAGARHRARVATATTRSSRATTCSGSGRSPTRILDYLVFARRYVMECEERHGAAAVEEVLDACHALMPHGVDRYRRPAALTLKAEAARLAEREAHRERQFNDLWRTVPENGAEAARARERSRSRRSRRRTSSTSSRNTRRSSSRGSASSCASCASSRSTSIRRRQTKVMNEGWATFWHYTILNRLHEKGLVDDGFMLEFLKSHTNVVAQPAFDSKAYSGLNPYALGFAMFRDLRRICEQPDAEDREWFPELAGSDWQHDARLRDAQLQGRIVHRASTCRRG